MPRICYATNSEIIDRTAFSGTVHNIHRALQARGADIDVLERIEWLSILRARLGMRVSRALLGSGTYQVERTASIARKSASFINRHLRHHPANAVFSNSTTTVAELPGDVPLVVYTDATFKGLRELYPELSDYPEHRVAIGEELERKAIQRATSLVYTSSWAAASAINHYGAHPSKVHVIPRGGDLGPALGSDTLSQNISSRSRERCELLLVGVSWSRKGGPLATRILHRLIATGIPARLTVVGCAPPKGTNRSHMEIHPFMNKGNEDELGKLVSLFDRSHFLVMPSEAECFGIVYAEASSRALPSLARDTGGVSDAVRSGYNGHLFRPDASVEDYVSYIMSHWNDRGAYADLCRKSYAEYRTRLNWELVGGQLIQVISDAVNHSIS